MPAYPVLHRPFRGQNKPDLGSDTSRGAWKFQKIQREKWDGGRKIDSRFINITYDLHGIETSQGNKTIPLHT